MNPFEPVQKWAIPRSALIASLTEMAIDGRHGREGVALWLGRRQHGIATISAVVALRGPGVRKQRDVLVISAALLNDVTDVAIERGESLVGQIHSHGPEFGVELSPTDQRFGIQVPDYLSVVAPDFALRPATNVTDCGLNVYAAGRGYRGLSGAEIAERIEVVDGVNVPVLTVGE